MNRLKGTNGAPKRTTRPTNVNAGWPKGGDTYGHGTPIVGSVGSQRKRRGNLRKEMRARPLIKAGRVGIVEKPDRKVREMRDASSILGLIRERGKKGLPLERVYRLLYNNDLFLMAYGKI